MKKTIISQNTPVILGDIGCTGIALILGRQVHKGDILYCQNSNNKWLIIIKEIEEEKVHYFASYKLKADLINTADWCRVEYVKRFATPTEKVRFYEALGHEGYAWDSTKQTLFETGDKRLVPFTIGIYKLQYTDKPDFYVGDGLFLNSGESNELLCVNDAGFAVFKNSNSLFERVQCYLVPCKYSELKCGDTAYKGGQYKDSTKIKNYVKILQKGYVSFHHDSPVRSYNQDEKWYKVIPYK